MRVGGPPQRSSWAAPRDDLNGVGWWLNQGFLLLGDEITERLHRWAITAGDCPGYFLL